MTTHVELRRGAYHDSVSLMQVSRAVAGTPGVAAAQVAMATDAGILVVEAGGAQRVVPWPPELAGPFDTRPAVLWRPDDAGFVVMHWQRPWLVDLEGNGEPAPFGGERQPPCR